MEAGIRNAGNTRGCRTARNGQAWHGVRAVKSNMTGRMSDRDRLRACGSRLFTTG